jgi:energy-coupling factor transporter ATP-binding protein EcfA2
MSVKIKEIPNDKLKITPFKMSNDGIIPNVEPPLPNNYGFFMLLIGAPGSGKSTLWLNLITNKEKHGYYKKFDKIHIFSNSLKTITRKIHLPDDRLHDGVNDLEETIEMIKETEDKVLLIIDDCVTDLKSPDYLLKLIYNRRHLGGGISIIITSQVYNKVHLSIRKAANTLVLFSTGNKKEIASVYQDFMNIPEKEYNEIVTFCFRHGSHDFMVYQTSTGRFYHNFNPLEIEFE